MSSPCEEQTDTHELSRRSYVVEAQRYWEEKRAEPPTLFPDLKHGIYYLEAKIEQALPLHLVEALEMAPITPFTTQSGQDGQDNTSIKREVPRLSTASAAFQQSPIVISLLSDSEDETPPTETVNRGRQRPTAPVSSPAPMMSTAAMTSPGTADSGFMLHNTTLTPAPTSLPGPQSSAVAKGPPSSAKSSLNRRVALQPTVYYGERPVHTVRTWKFNEALQHTLNGRGYLKFSKPCKPEEDTSGALIPTNYSLHHDNKAAYVCAVRDCQALFPSWDGLGKHFRREHYGLAFNDNMDGTLSFVGEYAPLHPGWTAIIAARVTLPVCVPEPAPKQIPKDSHEEVVPRITKEATTTNTFAIVKPIKQLTTNLAVVESEVITYMHKYMHCYEVPHVLCILKMARLPRHRTLPKQFLTSEYNNPLRPVESVHYAIALAWLTGREVYGRVACSKSTSNPMFPQSCVSITAELTTKERGQFGYEGCVSCIHASVVAKRQVKCDWGGFLPQSNPIAELWSGRGNDQNDSTMIDIQESHEPSLGSGESRAASSSPPMLLLEEFAASVKERTAAKLKEALTLRGSPKPNGAHMSLDNGISAEMPERPATNQRTEQCIVEAEATEQDVPAPIPAQQAELRPALSEHSSSLYEEEEEEAPPSATKSTRPANKKRRRHDRLSSGSLELAAGTVERRKIRTRASTRPAQCPQPPTQPESNGSESDWEQEPGYVSGGPYENTMAITSHPFYGTQPVPMAPDIGAHGIVLHVGEEHEFEVKPSWMRSCSVATGKIRINMWGKEHTLREGRSFVVWPQVNCILKNIGQDIAKIHCTTILNYEVRDY